MRAKKEKTRERMTLLQNFEKLSQIAAHPMWLSPYFPTYPIAAAAPHAPINKIVTICQPKPKNN